SFHNNILLLHPLKKSISFDLQKNLLCYLFSHNCGMTTCLMDYQMPYHRHNLDICNVSAPYIHLSSSSTEEAVAHATASKYKSILYIHSFSFNCSLSKASSS